MDVIGSAGTSLRVKPGDPWPAPYRGSRYTVQTGRGITLVGWKRDPLAVQARPFPSGLARYVRAVKGSNGSFRVTPHGAVITKVPVQGGSAWEPTYVGKYENDLQFDGIDNNPSNLQLGMYWTGLPFVHGEYWRFSANTQGNGLLQWRSMGWTHPSTSPYPELTDLCLDVRPNGGRIYFTESGCIWMNVPDNELAQKHFSRFTEIQRQQLQEMKQAGMRAALRLLFERIQATGCRPIYVGRVTSFDHGEPPWTAFDAEPPIEPANEIG